MNIERFKKECFYKEHVKSMSGIIVESIIVAAIVIWIFGTGMIGNFLLFLICFRAWSKTNDVLEYNKRLREELNIFLL